MRPHTRKPKKRAVEKALTTTIQSSFGWLRGFPIPGRAWQVAPKLSRADKAPKKLSRELLRACQYALRSIPRRFPIALTRRYQSIDHWQSPILCRLSLIHDAIHENIALPHWSKLPFPRAVIAKANRVALLNPLFDRLIHAFIWTYWNQHETILAALSFLTEYQQSLIEISKYRPKELEITVLKLFQIHQKSPNKIAPIFTTLAQADFWTLATSVNSIIDTMSSHLSALHSSSLFFSGKPGLINRSMIRKAMKGSPELGQAIIDQLLLTHRRPLVDQRSYLILCGSLLPKPSVLAEWSLWWDQLKRLQNALPQPKNHDRIPIQFCVKQRRTFEETLTALSRSTPTPYYPDRQLVRIRTVFPIWQGETAEKMSRIIPWLEEKEVREFLRNWNSEINRPCHNATFIFRELAQFFKDRSGVEKWKLWTSTSPCWLSMELWDLHYDDDRDLSQREVQRLLAIIKLCLNRDLANPSFRPVKQFHKSWFFFQSLVHLDLSVDQLGVFASELAPEKRISYTKTKIQFYWALSQNNLS
ncbi:MAG: hypothetical protein P1V97_38745, partial [Planctomycetota bacterium]|nr:hypothetical protein [Planctomycetota bacterium]